MGRMNDRGFIRLAGVLGILAALLAFGNIVLGYAAVGGRTPPGTFSSVSAALPITGVDAGLFRWSAICDLFGFYLFLSPLMIVLGRRILQARTHLRHLALYCGLGYVLVGAIAAAALLANAPTLIDAYAQASEVERTAIKVAYDTVNNILNGLWNILGVTLGGVWWITLGNAIRSQRPALGVLSLSLGIVAWLDALGAILSIPVLFAIGLVGVLLLIPTWSLVFGIDLVRHPEPA